MVFLLCIKNRDTSGIFGLINSGFGLLIRLIHFYNGFYLLVFLSGASIKGCCLLPGLNRLSSLQNYLLIRRSLLENFRFGHVVQQVIGSIIIEIVSDRLTDCREWNIDNARNVSEGQLVDQRVVNDVDSLLM